MSLVGSQIGSAHFLLTMFNDGHENSTSIQICSVASILHIYLSTVSHVVHLKLLIAMGIRSN